MTKIITQLLTLGRPEWLPNEMTGFRPSEYDFENRPPPGFMPSPYNENPSTGEYYYNFKNVY